MKIETLQFQPRAAAAPLDDLAVKLAAESPRLSWRPVSVSQAGTA